jgi:catalase
MVLDRNPDNFFAETEQVAFHTANLVPGIDFTNDPLLQARNFSYLDTQLIRLGGPNFSHLPINRPVTEVRTHQHDGFGQQTIQRGKASYHKNSLGSGCPALADEEVFTHYAQRVDGHAVRARSDSFADHYSQPRLFWRSMSGVEAEHIVAAFGFELGKVTDVDIRESVVAQLDLVDHGLASRVATKLGLHISPESPVVDIVPPSPALSQLNTAMDSIVSRRVAVLAADGVDVTGVDRLVEALTERGAIVEVLAPKGGGVLSGGSGGEITVDRAITTMASVLYDAVVVPGGPDSIATLRGDGYALHFLAEAYKHAKPIAAFGAGLDLIPAAGLHCPVAEGPDVHTHAGVVTSTAAEASLADEFFDIFSDIMARHRAWDREVDSVPA